MAKESEKDTTGKYTWDDSINDAINGINNTLPNTLENFRNKHGVLKGYLKNNVTGGFMEFLYNPESMNYNRAIRFSTISSPGNSYPVFQYVGGDAKSYSIDLFLFDKSGDNKVTEHIKFIEALCPPAQAYTPFKKPPTFILAYGRIADICLLESYDVSETAHDKNLNPTIATVKLSIKKVG